MADVRDWGRCRCKHLLHIANIGDISLFRGGLELVRDDRVQFSDNGCYPSKLFWVEQLHTKSRNLTQCSSISSIWSSTTGFDEVGRVVLGVFDPSRRWLGHMRWGCSVFVKVGLVVSIGPFHEHVVHAVHFLSVDPTFVRIPCVVGSDRIPAVAHLIKILRQNPCADMDTNAGVSKVSWADVVRGQLGEPPIVDLHVAVVNGAIGIGISGRRIQTGLYHGDGEQQIGGNIVFF